MLNSHQPGSPQSGASANEPLRRSALSVGAISLPLAGALDLDQLARKFRARYGVGSIELNDALFLYWLVRQTKPHRIVQCGAFNGQASAFMMLALAKNGPDGTLTIIDQSPIFDPEDPSWTVEGKIYGAVLPPGKTSAWMVPDQYRARLQILNGEVSELLPKVVDDLDAIDLFYYASDHAYQQIMPAFEQAKRKLRQGGLVVVGAAHMAGRDVTRDRMLLGRIDDAAITQSCRGQGGHAAQLAAAQDADGRTRRQGLGWAHF